MGTHPNTHKLEALQVCVCLPSLNTHWTHIGHICMYTGWCQLCACVLGGGCAWGAPAQTRDAGVPMPSGMPGSSVTLHARALATCELDAAQCVPDAAGAMEPRAGD